MKISHKLILILSVLSLCLLFISIFGWNGSKNQHASIQTIYEDRVIPLRDLKIIADAYAVSIIDLTNKTNAGLITAENAAKEISNTEQLIKQKWQKYIATTLTSEESRLSKEAEHLFISADESINNLLGFLQTKHGLIPNELTAYDGPLYATVDPISNKINELVELQLNVVDREYKNSSDEYDNISLLNIIGILVGISASIASFMVGSAIISQLSHLGAEPLELSINIKKIADGNLSLKIDDTDAREGSIVKEINKMSAQLNLVITDVNEVSSNLTTTADHLLASSEKTMHDLHNQQQQTEQVATAMHEMSATITEVARNAQEVAENSVVTQQVVDDGGAIIDTSLESIRSLVNNVENAFNVISQLKNDSSEIGKILEVIQSIAEQTNLLALNAAIEAARAGEQGRGFAVVADEVRTLASRTHSSTQEIQTMIQKLQGGVSNAVNVMEKSRSNSHETADYANKTQEILQSIKKSVSEIIGKNIQIATATEEQTMVADEIHQNITNISSVTELTVSSITEVEKSSRKLATYSSHLKSKISFFK
jgi:methyl-accepting chemotaxis protein